jgi:peptidoglycan/xylan/chitin deacetylase (PgdA/CDA1 family)
MGVFRTLFAALFVLSSAAHAGSGSRPVSGAPEDELWNSLHEQFLLGEELLHGFDEEIKKGRTLPLLISGQAGDPRLYARLQAIRILREELEEELEARVMLSFTIEDSASTGSGMETWVRKRAGKFRERAGIDKRTFEFALAPLLQYAKDLDQQRGFGLESLSSPLVLEDFRRWRERFRKRGAKVRGISALRQEVDRLASGIREGWAEGLIPEPARKNPDLKIFPSTSRAGNISGSGFPEGRWAITFDDGPGPLTPRVLDNLKTHGLRASFFVLTSQLEKDSQYAAYSRQAVQDGHDVFSHSYRHLKIPSLPLSSQKHEIEEALSVFESILGFRPDLFRLPYGAGVNIPAVRESLLRSCQVHVFWNVDTLDWQDRDPASIFDRARAQMHSLGGGVILFHDIHWQSVIASEKVMAHLQSEGLETITLSDFVNRENGGARWECKPDWSRIPD